MASRLRRRAYGKTEPWSESRVVWRSDVFRLRRNGGRSSPSLVQLVKSLVHDGLRLVRVEIDLVKARFAQALRKAGIGVALVLAALILALFGVAGLLVTAGIALAIVLPAWGAGLIVAAALLLACAGAGALGISQLRAAADARRLGPFELETELQEARHRLEADLEALSSRFDPRHPAQTKEPDTVSANGQTQLAPRADPRSGSIKRRAAGTSPGARR
jgi:Putative Actinobacterial Holin-X, holin superfamily III